MLVLIFYHIIIYVGIHIKLSYWYNIARLTWDKRVGLIVTMNWCQNLVGLAAPKTDRTVFPGRY